MTPTALGYLLIFVLVAAVVRCAKEERYYKSSQSTTSTGHPVYQATLTKRSKIECGIACRENTECQSFSFEKKSGSCKMSSGIMGNVTEKVYHVGTDKHCPKNLGYSLESDLNLCYRIQTDTPASFLLGKQDCEQDGGHFVSILDQTTHAFLVQKLNDLGVSLPMMIDGSDEEMEGVWKTTHGSTMNWFVWKGTNPNGGTDANCLELLGPDYGMSDYLCSSTTDRGHICQIDL